MGLKGAKVQKKPKQLSKSAKTTRREMALLQGRRTLDQVTLKRGEARRFLVACWPLTATNEQGKRRAMLDLGNDETKRVLLAEPAVALAHKAVTQKLMHYLRHLRASRQTYTLAPNLVTAAAGAAPTVGLLLGH